MFPQDLIKMGYFTAASTAVDKDVDVGWIPDFVMVFNEYATAAKAVSAIWARPMGDDKGIVDTIIADNGTTANKNRAFVSSNGITALNTTKNVPDVWKASTLYAVGDICHPTVNNGYLYRCTTAGTSHSAEPTSWGTTVGGTTSEGGGTVVWTCLDPGDLTYSKVKKTKVQGFTVAAELQVDSTKMHWIAMRVGNMTE